MDITLNDLKLIKEYNYQQYLKKYNINQYDSNLENELVKIIDSKGIDIQVYTKLINNNKQKFYRLHKKLEFLLSHGICYFCTWTISDDNMNKDHRRKLKELYKGMNYIINVDYAPNTNRKHYHGVILSEDLPKSWDYGFCKFMKINTSSRFIAKYINKFTAHALKIGTEKESIIYSKGNVMKAFNFYEKLRKKYSLKK